MEREKQSQERCNQREEAHQCLVGLAAIDVLTRSGTLREVVGGGALSDAEEGELMNMDVLLESVL